jgi:hypothetical protein
VLCEQRNFYRRVIVRLVPKRTSVRRFDADCAAYSKGRDHTSGSRFAGRNQNPMPNIVLLASGLVVFVCALLVIGRAVTRFSPTSVREDLTVSRGWLLDHQSRNPGE